MGISLFTYLEDLSGRRKFSGKEDVFLGSFSCTHHYHFSV